jgi:hypothetical protein
VDFRAVGWKLKRIDQQAATVPEARDTAILRPIRDTLCLHFWTTRHCKDGQTSRFLN